MADILARNPKLDDVLRKAANKLGENHGLARDTHGAMIDNQGNSMKYVGSHGQHPSQVNKPKSNKTFGWHRTLNEMDELELEEDCLGEGCGETHEDEEMEEATGSGSSGAYVGPIFGKFKENVKETEKILESVMRNEVSKIINEQQELQEKGKACFKSNQCPEGCRCSGGGCVPFAGDEDVDCSGKRMRVSKMDIEEGNDSQQELHERPTCASWCYGHGGTCEGKYGPCNIPDSGSFDRVTDIPKGGVKGDDQSVRITHGGSGFKTPQGASDRLEKFNRRQMKESLKNRLTKSILNESYAEPIYEVEFDDSKNLLTEADMCWHRRSFRGKFNGCMRKPCGGSYGGAATTFEAMEHCDNAIDWENGKKCCEMGIMGIAPPLGDDGHEMMDRERIYEVEFDDSKNLLTEEKKWCWWRSNMEKEGGNKCEKERKHSSMSNEDCQTRRRCLGPDGEFAPPSTGGGVKTQGKKDRMKYSKDASKNIVKSRLQEKAFYNTGKFKYEKPTSMPGDSKNTPGINLTKKVLNKAKSETNSHLKQVDKKIKDYLDFEGNSHPEFPHQNNSKTDYKSPMYRNSTEDEEFIDDFRGMGLEDANGVDTLDRIGDYLNGSSETGNAQTSKDGKALGNVVPNKVGEKVLKKVKRKKAKIAKQKSKMTNLRGYTPDVQAVVKESTKIKHLFEYKEKTQ